MSLTTKHQRLAALRPLSPESVASLAAAWDVRMVYESNSIEGNSLTLRETEIVLSKGVTVSGKPLKDHLEAVNLLKAWEHAKQLSQVGTPLRGVRLGQAQDTVSAFTEDSTSPQPDGSESRPYLTERDLLDLHRIILTGVADSHAGQYRTFAVRTAGSNLVPPNPIKVPDLMEELFSGIPLIADPVERAAALHHGIARIHPFTDGNGRTARLAMNFVLLAAGYPPISIPTELRQEYYAALEAADFGDFPAWLEFLSRQLNQELDQWLEALEISTPDPL